jgi:hypothetical protein
MIPAVRTVTVDDMVRAQRHEALRRAGTAVLSTFDDEAAPADAVRAALAILSTAVRGDIPEIVDRPSWPEPDPARHFLSLLGLAPISKTPPRTLAEQAVRMRDQLAGDRSVEETRPGDDNIEFGGPRALALASLLSESAARLIPGAAFGLTRDGEALAAIARDLSQELLAQTVLGRG